MPDPTSYFDFIKDLGGWGALVIFVGALLYMLWRGGNAFLGIANRFSTDVVGKLEEIRKEMSVHNERLADLDERVHTVYNRVDQLAADVAAQVK